MPGYAYAVLGLGWLAWVVPFFLPKRRSGPLGKVDRRARWGILLEGVAYWMIWQGRSWERPLPGWRLGLAVLFLAAASLLSWTAVRALGRQWRIDAGLSTDHELVMAGPYRLVRHPIYTSMLCLALGMGFILTRLPILALAILVFMIGTEIRVRIEDGLLGERFGDRFRDYQRAVPAYIPFAR
jgi:protein-S-isoprenylcysteine O-methyltransferase Ste14